MKYRHLLLLFSLLIFICPFSYGQDKATIEKQLHAYFNRIDYWHEKVAGEYTGYDSLNKANQVFREKLISYTTQYPSTIKQSFQSLVKDGLYIATSPDGLLRMYSWDTWLGGSMHDFLTVVQFQSGDKTLSRKQPATTNEKDPQCFYSEVHQIEVNGKTFYLGVYHAIYSSKDVYQAIKLFAIENGKVNGKVKLIKTKTGIRNELRFSYDFFSVVDRPERPVKLISYNKDTKTISIPVVYEDGKVTQKQIRYQFTGQYFEKTN